MEGTLHEDKTFEKITYPGKEARSREFERCTFRGCDFSGTDFSRTRFANCTFTGCNLAMVKLKDATLDDVVFKDCKLIGINFSECNDFLFAVRFDSCILDFASFLKRKMPKTQFKDTSMKGVIFSQSTLTNAVFQNTDLAGAVFENTLLAGADLSTAFNFEIDPEQNNLKKAKFSSYGLQGLLTKYNLEVV